MKRNTTKDKGDTGLGFVISDLISRGFYIFLPISEHLPFDLIASDQKGKLSRVQVKYRELYKSGGTIRIKLASVYSTAKGTHVRPIDANSFDGMAIYCPNTSKVYYVPSSVLLKEDGKCMSELSLCVSRIGRRAYARMGDDYTDPRMMFGEIP